MLPKDLVCYLLPVENQDIAEIAIRARIMPEPGVLAKISGILAKHNVRILALNFSSEKDKRFLLAFIDMSNSDVSINSLINELKQLEFIEKIVVRKKSVNSFIVSRIGYPITTGRGAISIVLLNRNSFSNLIRTMYEEMSDVGMSFMFYQGKLLGSKDAEVFVEHIWTIDQDTISEILNILLAHGWGIPKLIKFSSSEVIVHLYDSFESLVMAKKSERPMCFFIKGYIAGLLSTILKKEVHVEETKCIAMGDPYCEFRIKIP